MDIYIGRQPIYNSDFVVAGYELLYRNNNTSSVRVTDADAATRSVLTDAITVYGLPQLTNGLPAYINFTENLIMDGFAFLAKPSEIVVEVPSNITINQTVIGKLNELRHAGYLLSLNSYGVTNAVIKFRNIVDMFDIVRMDLSQNNRLRLKDLISQMGRGTRRLLAEKVETEEDFDTALKLRFSLFQGYYFERPVNLSKTIQLSRSVYGLLLNELSNPDCQLAYCKSIILSDPIMTHTLLSVVTGGGSSYFRGNYDKQVETCIMRLGEKGLRWWLGVALLKFVNATTSDELPREAYLRARFMETLAENSLYAQQNHVLPGIAFFIGLFSKLDQVMGVTVRDLFEDLDPVPEIYDTLMGNKETQYTPYLQYALTYEIASGQLARNKNLRFPDIGLKFNNQRMSLMYMELIRATDIAYHEFNVAPLNVYAGNILR